MSGSRGTVECCDAFLCGVYCSIVIVFCFFCTTAQTPYYDTTVRVTCASRCIVTDTVTCPILESPIGTLHAAGLILLLLELLPLHAALCMRGRYQRAAWRACSNRYTECIIAVYEPLMATIMSGYGLGSVDHKAVHHRIKQARLVSTARCFDRPGLVPHSLHFTVPTCPPSKP